MEMGIETLRARGLGPEARGGKKDTFSVASFSPKTNSLAPFSSDRCSPNARSNGSLFKGRFRIHSDSDGVSEAKEGHGVR